MKRWKSILLIAALVLMIAACGGDDEPESTEPIKIGLLTSLASGPFVPWGVQARDGMLMAAEEINADGGVNGRMIEIVEADDPSAVAAFLSTEVGAEDLEDRLAAAGLCATMARTPQEWARHPHGRAVAALPLLEIVRVGAGPARRHNPAPDRPLLSADHPRVASIPPGRSPAGPPPPPVGILRSRGRPRPVGAPGCSPRPRSGQ